MKGPRRLPPPDWTHLYEVAAAQAGLFTTEQAADAGYSPQLLVHYARSGKVVRLRRGIYRLVHFPAGEHEDLVELWLWSSHQGVLSHQTALALHGLSDILPSRVHLTVPTDWRSRRLRVPTGVVLHYAAVLGPERSWHGAVPLTSPVRTLIDCATAQLSPDLLSQALQQALERGLISEKGAADIGRVAASSGSSP
jgi:predicted transcriptional regulator of viral defense system